VKLRQEFSINENVSAALTNLDFILDAAEPRERFFVYMKSDETSFVMPFVAQVELGCVRFKLRKKPIRASYFDSWQRTWIFWQNPANN